MLLATNTCPYLGTQIWWRNQDGTIGWPERKKGHTASGSPSIDRIIPSGGYTPENTELISYRANRIKNDATFEELIAIGERAAKMLLVDSLTLRR